MSEPLPEAIAHEICAAVDALHTEQTQFLQELVRTPSLPDGEGPVQEKIARKLGALGLAVELLPTRFDELRGHPSFSDDGFSPDGRVNVIGRWPGASTGSPAAAGAGSLILNGHVDVVSPGDPALWQDDPWSGAVRDGRLFGRGACDMKAGLATAIFAVAALQRAGVRPAHDLLIESVIGEESGGVGTLSTIVHGYRADAVVVLEPTRQAICPVQAGALTFRLTVPGRAAHGAMKSEGVSAIAKFCLLHAAIEELDRTRHGAYANPLFENPRNVAPISIGTVRGGVWHSTVPEEVVAEGRCGVFPGESPADVRALLAGAIRQVAEADDWLRDHPPRLEWFEGQFAPAETRSDHPLVGALAACHRQVHGTAPRLEGVPYGADMRLFVNDGAMPALLYGPGDVRLAHTANESIDLADVAAGTKTVALLIARWCGLAEYAVGEES